VQVVAITSEAQHDLYDDVIDVDETLATDRRRSDFFVIHVPPYLKCAHARQEERTQFLLLTLVIACSTS
jgi:hypothetical protein